MEKCWKCHREEPVLSGGLCQKCASELNDYWNKKEEEK